MTIRQDAFTKDLGDDFVALDSRGHGVARASSLDALKAAAPDAAEYLDAAGVEKRLKSGGRPDRPAQKVEEPKPVKPGQEDAQLDPFDHDQDGHPGGSPKGDDSTVARGRAARQRKAAK